MRISQMLRSLLPRWLACVVALGTSAYAQTPTSVIPPSAKQTPRSSVLPTYEIPKAAENLNDLTQRSLERGATPFLRRGQQLEESLNELPWSSTPPIALDLQTPVGKTLSSAGKVLKGVGAGITAYNVIQGVANVNDAVERGGKDFDARVGDLSATVWCAMPVVDGVCLAGGLTGMATGVDPVEWTLKKIGEHQSHTAGMGCGGSGSPISDFLMEGSETCIKNRVAEWAEQSAKARADREAEFNQIAARNAAQALAKQAALDNYRATISTPAEELEPSSVQQLLNGINQGLLQQNIRANSSRPVTTTLVSDAKSSLASQCRPAKTLDPKTGCHPGHDEKGHPGGCKCG